MTNNKNILPDTSHFIKKLKSALTLDYLQIIYPPEQSEFNKNYCHFFESLAEKIDLKILSITGDSMKNLKSILKKNECHINSLATMFTHDNTFKFYFGFVDHELIYPDEIKYIGTVQHSFLVMKGKKVGIFDPSMAIHNYFEKEQWFHRGKNYIGVHIPDVLLKEIQGNKERVVNICNYLKREIFISTEKTDALIEHIKKLNAQEATSHR